MNPIDNHHVIGQAEPLRISQLRGKVLRAIVFTTTEPGPCDNCGAKMTDQGHCKSVCLVCGFVRTCLD
jgi:hypothetical protein